MARRWAGMSGEVLIVPLVGSLSNGLALDNRCNILAVPQTFIAPIF